MNYQLRLGSLRPQRRVQRCTAISPRVSQPECHTVTHILVLILIHWEQGTQYVALISILPEQPSLHYTGQQCSANINGSNPGTSNQGPARTYSSPTGLTQAYSQTMYFESPELLFLPPPMKEAGQLAVPQPNLVYFLLIKLT